MKEKPKRLGEYISEGRHELVAFVRGTDPDPTDEDSRTKGNKLGESHLGVLVCDKKNKPDSAYFFYKDKPKHKGDPDIARMSLSYNLTKVVSKFPLTLSSKDFLVGWHFIEKEVYREGRRVLEEHGLY